MTLKTTFLVETKNIISSDNVVGFKSRYYHTAQIPSQLILHHIKRSHHPSHFPFHSNSTVDETVLAKGQRQPRKSGGESLKGIIYSN